MNTIKVLQQGGIKFFYRPRIGHDSLNSLDDIQRFFFILKPENASHYHLVIVGKKNMPKKEAAHYFSFVESVENDHNNIINKLKEKTYVTKKHEEHHEPHAQSLGIGAYVIILHNRHTHLIYHLEKPKRISSLQKDFHLQRDGDYIINVKNPLKLSGGKGLNPKKKAYYPTILQNKFKNRNFISLSPPTFLDYPGAELLLTYNAHSDLTKEKKSLKKNISSRDLDDFLQKLE